MTASPTKPAWTDSGIPVESDKHSLTVGPDPPILLQDHYPIEQITQRNRERVLSVQPRRQGHAGAFGYSEVTDDPPPRPSCSSQARGRMRTPRAAPLWPGWPRNRRR